MSPDASRFFNSSSRLSVVSDMTSSLGKAGLTSLVTDSRVSSRAVLVELAATAPPNLLLSSGNNVYSP